MIWIKTTVTGISVLILFLFTLTKPIKIVQNWQEKSLKILIL